MNLLGKMRGEGKAPPRVSWTEIACSWMGALIGLSLLGALHEHVADPAGQILLIGSFGASAVLVFGAPKSPLAQPRNLIGGHVISAVIGVSVQIAAPGPAWLTAALASSLAIAAMHATRTLHPPGGATALIAVAGGGKITALGYAFVLIPAATGACILLFVAVVFNNLVPRRKYPEYWW